MQPPFNQMAQYNLWANRRLYDACAQLSPQDYHAARPCFFGSLHATLNHILAGDRVWLGRFENKDYGIASLDQMLFEDFLSLRAAREAEDRHIIDLMAEMDEARLSQDLVYRSMTENEDRRTPMQWALLHFFNHQTHHRGQVHDQLTQTPVAPPPLDLIYFIS